MRRTTPIVLPIRRAESAAHTFFTPSVVRLPVDAPAAERILRGVRTRVSKDEGAALAVPQTRANPSAPGVLDLILVAMAPAEELCVEAVRLLRRLPNSALRAHEGELFALVQVHLARREDPQTLLTPALEALLTELPFWPEPQSSPVRVAGAPTTVWSKDVRAWVARDGAIEDPDLPLLLELSERFGRLHSDLLRRLATGDPPSRAATERLVTRYEPAILPLVRHADPRVAGEARAVAMARLEAVGLPESVRDLPDFATEEAIEARSGRTEARLINLVVQEYRPDLLPSSVTAASAHLLKRLWQGRSLIRLDLTTPGHQFLVLAGLAASATDEPLPPEMMERLAELLAESRAPAKLLASVFSHSSVDERLLESMLAGLLEKGRRIIDQSRRLSDPLFPHHRPAFRSAMVEGYRRTIGSPWLVKAVFMATPPEAIHESLRFLMENHARSLPRLVRGWIDANPDGTGRTRIPEHMLHALLADPNPGMSIAGELLAEYQGVSLVAAQAPRRRSRR